MEKVKSIAIILLNWNSYHHTNECLESLMNCTYDNFQAIVVDNASTDDSLIKLKEKYNNDKIIFLQSFTNRGFSGGCNIGIVYALYKEYDFIMLLNNDTIVDSNFLSELVKESDNHRDYSIFGGKAYYYEEPEKIHMAGAKINWLKGNYIRYGAGCVDRDRKLYNKVREVEFTSAYFLMAKSEVFKNIGLLCEDYFFGEEEVDFGARYSRYGYKVLYIPTSIIWHKIAGSHAPATAQDIYNVYRNKLIFMEKFLSKKTFFVWRLCFAIYGKSISPRRLYKFHISHGGNNKYEDIKCAIRCAINDSYISKKMTQEDYLKFKK